MFDPLTLLAGLIPIFTEAGKAAVNRWIVPDAVKPANVSELLQMRSADIELFKALSDAGGTGDSYPWVTAVRQLQRPFVVLVVLLAWCALHLAPAVGSGALSMVDNFAASIGFYLFADRSLFYARPGKQS